MRKIFYIEKNINCLKIFFIIIFLAFWCKSTFAVEQETSKNILIKSPKVVENKGLGTDVKNDVNNEISSDNNSQNNQSQNKNYQQNYPKKFVIGEPKKIKKIPKTDLNNQKINPVNNSSALLNGDSNIGEIKQNKIASQLNQDLEVIGLERIDKGTILQLINLKNLKNNVLGSVQNSLKKLYESDLFVDVKIYRRANKIIIEVKENPIISEVKFIGNDKIDDDTVKKLLYFILI